MSYQVLENILHKDHRVGVLVATPSSVTWAYDKMRQLVGEPEAQEQLKALNALRKRYGKVQIHIQTTENTNAN